MYLEIFAYFCTYIFILYIVYMHLSMVIKQNIRTLFKTAKAYCYWIFSLYLYKSIQWIHQTILLICYTTMTQNRARNNQSRTKKSEPSSTSFLATTARGFHYTKQNLRFSSSILLKFIFTQRYRNYALKYVWLFCNSKIKLNLVINVFCKFQKLPACLSLCLYLCQRRDNVLGFMMRVLGNRL